MGISYLKFSTHIVERITKKPKNTYVLTWSLPSQIPKKIEKLEMIGMHHHIPSFVVEILHDNYYYFTSWFLQCFYLHTSFIFFVFICKPEIFPFGLSELSPSHPCSTSSLLGVLLPFSTHPHSTLFLLILLWCSWCFHHVY